VKKVVYVAIDIEAGGSMYTKHPLLAIGVCVGSLENGVIEKRVWCMDRYLQEKDKIFMEEKCKTEFWDKHPDVLKKIDANAKPLAQQIRDFAKFLDKLEVTHKKRKIVFLSDNPAFDIAWVDYFLMTIAERPPCRYSTEMVFRSVKDPGRDHINFTVRNSIENCANKLSSHNHWPSDDAQQIFFLKIVSEKLEGVIDYLKLAPIFADAIRKLEEMSLPRLYKSNVVDTIV